MSNNQPTPPTCQVTPKTYKDVETIFILQTVDPKKNKQPTSLLEAVPLALEGDNIKVSFAGCCTDI